MSHPTDTSESSGTALSSPDDALTDTATAVDTGDAGEREPDHRDRP